MRQDSTSLTVAAGAAAAGVAFMSEAFGAAGASGVMLVSMTKQSGAKTQKRQQLSL